MPIIIAQGKGMFSYSCAFQAVGLYVNGEINGTHDPVTSYDNTVYARPLSYRQSVAMA
ncbi:MAG: hypothetical protein ACUVWO_04245 [Thermodesulfobacteriota bacterium]